jgi:YVTN family beta-propeller protein
MRETTRRRLVVMALVLPTLAGSGVSGAAPEVATRVRRPTALALVDGGRLLLAANARSGSISVIDTASHRLEAEHDVGKGLADLAPLPDGTHLLAADAAANEVLLLERHGVSLGVVSRVEVSPDPIRVVAIRGGSSAVVASRWPRRLTVLAMAEPPRPGLELVRTIELPFSPREMVDLPGDAGLVVADAFGGKLALVDVAGGSVRSVRSLPAHNIRGLALAPDGKALAVSHQALNPLARTTFDDVHWGLLVSNHVRVLEVNAILKPWGDLLEASRLIDLGDVGRGAGDPSALVPDAGGGLVVALEGVGELGIVPRAGRPQRRVAVGRHPTALAAAADGKTVYVADGFDDTISVVDLAGGRRVASVTLGPRPEETLAERGARLFRDARLSHDGWMSCQSCHTDGHSSGLSSDTLGDGSYGAAKRIPSLLGVAATGPWTWTGSIARLEDQVRQSIQTTMQGPKGAAGDENVQALTAYLRTLPPLSPALTANRPVGDDAASRGRATFRARKCDTCHVPPEYTAAERFDVGLDDEVGNRAFNPPSLLGVSRREPLLHDGRAATLEDLFTRHRHPRETPFEPREVADLVAFLRTL